MHTLLRSSLAVAVALALIGCGPKTPEAHLEAAKEALQANDYKTAEIELKTLLQDAPANAEARLLLAQTMQARGRWEDSEKELRKAQDQGASPEQTLPMLATALVKMGNHEEAAKLQAPNSGMGSEAMATFQAERANAFISLNKPADASTALTEGEQALVSAGKSADASKELQLAKARLAIINGQYDQAMSLLDRALEHSPKFVEAMYLKAQALGMTDKRDEALKVYEQITAAKPNEILAYLAIAQQKMRDKDISGAEKALAQAEKINSNMLLVKFSRATLEYGKGNLRRASDVLQQILRVTSDHMPTLLLDATVNYGLGRYEQSLKSASRVLASTEGNLLASKLVTMSNLRLGNAQAALVTALPVLKNNPGESQFEALAGEAYLQLKQYDKAMAYLDRASAQQPKDVGIKEARARGYMALGQLEKAQSDLEAAAQMSDKAGSADMSLVMLHLRQGQFDQALAAINALEKKLPDNPVTHNLRAAAYMGQNNIAAARQSLEKALAIKPDFFPAATNLAKLDQRENKPEAAHGRYESILKHDPNSVPAMMALASLTARDGNETDYLRWLERAAKVDSRSLPPREGLVRYYLSKKQPARALPIALEAVNGNTDSPEALNLLGAAQLATGDTASALSTFTRVTDLRPNSPQVFYRLGLAQYEAKSVERARASFEKALSMEPAYADALDALIRLEIAQSNVASALKRLRAHQAAHPNTALGYDREGRILNSQKQYTEAVKAFQKAIALGAKSASLIELHRTLVLAGDTATAQQKLSDWIKRYPRDTAVRAYAAGHYLQTKRYPQAITQYEALLASAPNNALIFNNLAVAYQAEGDPKAKATAEKAFAINSDNAAIMDTLGWILVQGGEVDKGLGLLGKSLEKRPDVSSTRYHWAVALAKSGDKAKARSELVKLLKKTPAFPEAEDARQFLKGL